MPYVRSTGIVNDILFKGINVFICFNFTQAAVSVFKKSMNSQAWHT